MRPPELLTLVAAVAGGVFLVLLLIRGFWRAKGLYRIRTAGPRPIRASRHRIWRDPGPVASLSLVHGPGGADFTPAPPFAFIEEHQRGSQPCVSVRDARGRRWRVKWGHEVRCETFAVRFAWACGYFAEVTHFVASGVIDGAANLQRARGCIKDNGGFVDARFELDDPNVHKMFEEHGWAWNDNPFVETAELSGLKMVVMLLSNWDTKDRRDVARGSNTAIFEHHVNRWPRRIREAHYLLTDWGGSMGRWGTNIVTRGRWDADGFEAQTPSFVTGVDTGYVRFGYTGQRTNDVAQGIRVEHARWFHRYAGQLTVAQLAEALTVSGATDDEAGRFARALVDRIAQIGRVAGTATGAPTLPREREGDDTAA
jgi:hypothetical protein